MRRKKALNIRPSATALREFFAIKPTTLTLATQQVLTLPLNRALNKDRWLLFHLTYRWAVTFLPPFLHLHKELISLEKEKSFPQDTRLSNWYNERNRKMKETTLPSHTYHH